MSSELTSTDLTFQPRARLLQLLGDELIGSPRLAVFELVKNAYDADADSVQVTIRDIDQSEATIVVSDDGIGMTLATIRDIWLIPGHDHRERQRKAGLRTEKKRLPLGEKGLGRFAAHKLGDEISLVTKASNSLECFLSIDWAHVVRQGALSDVTVNVRERKPQVFKGSSTGTILTISKLRQKWTRGDIRRLHRQITSISSPFSRRADEFSAQLVVPDHPSWLDDIPDTMDLLRRAPWYYRFNFHRGQFDWHYRFRSIPSIKVQSRKVDKTSEPLLVFPSDIQPDDTPKRRKSVVADPTISAGIGRVRGRLYVFDRDKEVLARQSENRLIESLLDEHGGVRVYRDGIRVYNYGERDDDWLRLDLSRVNDPSVRISRNIVIGAIELDLEDSTALREKTNREGFVENDAFRRFRAIVRGALTPLESERKLDKDKIRRITSSARAPETSPINVAIGQLRRVARRHKLEIEFEPLIKKIERHYQEFRDTMVRAGSTTIGITLVFHEVEQGVRNLCDMIESQSSTTTLRRRARDLTDLLAAFTDLARRGERKENSLNELIRRVRDINRIRFSKHQIDLHAPVLDADAPQHKATFVFGNALGALNNLIDNAVYWLQVRWQQQSSLRKIYININLDLDKGPAVVVADNGPGLEDEPNEVTRPFFSRRPEGMGLGLYYASMVMEMGDGNLTFPRSKDADVPDEFDGAVVALIFPVNRSHK
ncbi:MAG: ATP-binding protein [Gammaproteobacteria bacterium]|nr:ATP-binding protein [Gammaproteobacteria bacterium]MYF01584.1 ATP-binding protein [Gammaproteobacteria bacterium]MYI77235.1 ATP-binding protein [Gammaproteobacteria bacterium]